MSDDMNTIKTTRRANVRLRKPTVEDGSDVWELISTCKPLDENSMYFNLIQCDHFADTCILAEREGQIVGWISGHIPPEKPDALFVWQVAVSPEARGLGLAGRMLRALFDRPELALRQPLPLRRAVLHYQRGIPGLGKNRIIGLEKEIDETFKLSDDLLAKLDLV